MKKFFRSMLTGMTGVACAVVLVLSAVPMTARAEGVEQSADGEAVVETVTEETEALGASTTITGESDGFTYEISSTGLTITGYTGTETEVVIPSALAGYKVTNIGKQAFKDNFTMTSVTIPEGVTSIAAEAFYGCTGLSEINFNAKNCTVPEPNTNNSNKGAGVFSGAGSASASGLTVNFGDKVTKVPDRLFDTASGTEYGKRGYSYAYVTKINFSSATTEIGSYAFWNCEELEEVNLTSAVAAIDEYAFENCLGLTTFTASDALSSIGESAFSGCTSLKTIVWGTGLGSIGKKAFYGCTALTTLDLPSPLDSVGQSAFADCSALTTLTLPESLTSLAGEVFCGCVKLNQITINSKNLTVPDVWKFSNNGGGVFSGAGSASLEGLNVTFASGITSICDSLFDTASLDDVYGHTGYAYAYVTSVEIPSTVKYIGEYAFRNCQELGAVTIENGSEGIGEDAFDGCTTNPDFKIIGYKSGKPIAYAIENSLPYEYLPCDHTTTEVRDAKAASCAEAGYSGDTYCTTCGDLIKEGTTINKTTNHTWNDGEVTKEATTTETGVITYTCTVCSETRIETIDKLVATEKVEDIFSDVVASVWYTEGVQYVYDNGYMVGAGSVFGTNEALTRAQVVQVLYSICGKPAVTYSDIFTDVKENNWYASAVIWAKEKEIAAGNANGTFGANDPITREALALMLSKFAEYQGYATDYTDDVLDSYSDQSSISSWAVTGLKWAVTQGVINGKGDKGNLKVAPQDKATRAECAVMMRKLLISQ